MVLSCPWWIHLSHNSGESGKLEGFEKKAFFSLFLMTIRLSSGFWGHISHFWPLESRFLMSEKNALFLKPSYFPISPLLWDECTHQGQLKTIESNVGRLGSASWLMCVINVYKSILSTPRRCCIQLVLGSSSTQTSPVSDLDAITKYSMSLHCMRLTLLSNYIQCYMLRGIVKKRNG